MRVRASLTRRLRAFRRDRSGASAVEFAIVSMPFIFMILAIIQLGIYFMTQSALDAGVIQTADYLVNSFSSNGVPTLPTATSLKTMVQSKTGGIIQPVGFNGLPPLTADFRVELREFSALTSAAVPIGNTVDATNPGDILALRAQASIMALFPGLSGLNVRSSALLRRQQ